ncbi:hypothetical protein RR46_06170 [Papilio xuthus]|uniref:Uncharacterized protein n=1 Tax=Papilio xuthus TaxID=66420 RepID=A0A194QC22_PAPXU|nr:hypothetical protein RR46_06170 [Papilio xuthus]
MSPGKKRNQKTIQNDYGRISNVCSGCTKCSCSAEGRWQCQLVHECPGSGDEDVVNADTISNAYEVLFNELSNMETKVEPIEPETQPEESRLLGNYEDLDEGQHIAPIVKRSVKDNRQNTSVDNANGTVKFYNIVDEINEDTLKNTNESGTIEAKQVNGVKVPKISRRTSVMDTKNITGISDLHIDFHEPKGFDHHIVDNKIDSLVRNEEKTRILNPSKIGEVIGNHSQQTKDKDLSQIVVNELKKGSEIIGNKEMTPVSNITFTPENDTLTAMAFIAGDLLSKLWKLEKESSVESMETEVLKHEKLADLLELFKEPLTMRQELFIKNALERLSKALDKDRKLKNVSLCETLASSESILGNSSRGNQEDVIEMHTNCKNSNDSIHQHDNNPSDNGTIEAISKIKSILNLVRKFENVEFKLNLLRNGMHLQNVNSTQDIDLMLSKDESKSINVFGNVLEKITKLLLPKKSKKAKKFMTKVRHMNLFGNSDDIKKELKQIMGINTDNLNLTSKDKLVIDYLNIFKMNPNCAFKGQSQKDASALPSIKGDTYENISKLLNVKSMDDIVELISPSSNSNTKKKEKELINITTETNLQTNNDRNEDEKFNLTKNKLKIHITAIFNDLKELQNQSGTFLEENRDIVNILPCLYNLFNSAKSEANEITKGSKGSNLNNISLIFESLRNNLIGGSVSRRKEYTPLPGSTKVWERVIKNLNKQSKASRRNYNNGLKSFDEIKQIIENVDMSSNSYKEYANLVNVPISSHLILLKVIQASALQIVNALENIKSFVKSYIELPSDEEFVIKKFIDNAAKSINLNKRISDKLKTYKKKLQREDLSNFRVETVYKQEMRNPDYNVLETPIHGRYEEQKVEYNPVNVFTNNRFINKPKFPLYTVDRDVGRQSSNYKTMKIQEVDINDSNVFKLTRDQIISQLIKNRVELYIRIKEAKGIKSNLDINYNLAKRIRTQLESGNYSLAKELFSVFITNTVTDTNEFTPKNILKGNV